LRRNGYEDFTYFVHADRRVNRVLRRRMPSSAEETRGDVPGRGTALAGAVSLPKRLVYVLKNASEPPEYYTGVTSNIGARLLAHNEDRCPHTAGRGP
jgi:hypothetical protein